MLLPCMVPARSTARANACRNNLRLIDGAKEKWALENKIEDGAPVSKPELAKYMQSGWPSCPAGGSYILGVIGAPAECSFHDKR